MRLRKISILISMFILAFLLSGCVKLSSATETSVQTEVATTKKGIITISPETSASITTNDVTSATTVLPVTTQVITTTAPVASTTATTTVLPTVTTTMSLSTTSKTSITSIVSYYASLDLDNLLNKSSSEIETAVRNLISKATITISYTDTRDYFDTVDKDPKTGKTVLLYTQTLIDHFETSSQKYNREHVYPASIGNFSYNDTCGRDLHHIRPTLCETNSERGNKIYGSVEHVSGTEKTINGITYAYSSSTTFEPMDSVKGDVARICFYFAVCYNKPLSAVCDDVETLLEWNEEDPVSDIEVARNDAVYKIQNNRNIFIDYPELAEYIW